MVIALHNVIALMVCTGLLAFIYGRHCEQKESLQKRLEVVRQDRQDERSAHQRGALEKNVLGQFKNAIKATFGGDLRVIIVSIRDGYRDGYVEEGLGHRLNVYSRGTYSLFATVDVNVAKSGEEIWLSRRDMGNTEKYSLGQQEVATKQLLSYLRTV